jgi:omega-6 fatty acid desaturase (delta-12 desaturase)
MNEAGSECSSASVSPRVGAIVRFGQEHTMRELLAAIPPECLERNLPREMLSVAASLGTSIAAWFLLAVNPYGWLLPPLWFLAGTCAWGLMVIAHECGHGSFSASRRLNHWVGHLTMTPFLYPFHAWRLLHNHHHSNTNSVERDFDWRPLPVAVYLRLPFRRRWVYRLTRTWLWWLGTKHQLTTQAFDPRHVAFGRPHDRALVWFSIMTVAAYAAVFFPVMLYTLGVWGLIKYWMMPWLVAYGWFSVTTLMHHTHPTVPFLERKKWSPAASNLCLTVYCRFPRWMEFLAHDIHVHIPHHVAPHVPHFNLRRAHRALADRFPEQIVEMRFTWRALLTRLRDCQLYDRRSGLYLRFEEASADLVLESSAFSPRVRS